MESRTFASLSAADKVREDSTNRSRVADRSLYQIRRRRRGTKDVHRESTEDLLRPLELGLEERRPSFIENAEREMIGRRVGGEPEPLQLDPEPVQQRVELVRLSSQALAFGTGLPRLQVDQLGLELLVGGAGRRGGKYERVEEL